MQKPSSRVPSFLPIQDPLSGLCSPTTSPSPFPQLTLPYPSVLISVVSAPVECSLGSSLGQGDVLNILQYRMLLRSTVYSYTLNCGVFGYLYCSGQILCPVNAKMVHEFVHLCIPKSSSHLAQSRGARNYYSMKE